MNIAGYEEFLLGIHPSVRYRSWEGGNALGTIKSKLFVDTKVWGHGWRKRNAAFVGLHPLRIPTLSARCEKNVYKTTVHNPVMFSPPDSKMVRLVACRHEKRWASHPERCPNVKLVLGTLSPNYGPNDTETMPSPLDPHLLDVKFDLGKNHQTKNCTHTQRKPGARHAPPLAAWAPCPGNY